MRLYDARHEDGDEDVELERVGADDGGHDGELSGEGQHLVLGEVQSDDPRPCRDTVPDNTMMMMMMMTMMMTFLPLL